MHGKAARKLLAVKRQEGFGLMSAYCNIQADSFCSSGWQLEANENRQHVTQCRQPFVDMDEAFTVHTAKT